MFAAETILRRISRAQSTEAIVAVLARRCAGPFHLPRENAGEEGLQLKCGPISDRSAGPRRSLAVHAWCQ
jgi:hypothetical protein